MPAVMAFDVSSCRWTVGAVGEVIAAADETGAAQVAETVAVAGVAVRAPAVDGVVVHPGADSADVVAGDGVAGAGESWEGSSSVRSSTVCGGNAYAPVPRSMIRLLLFTLLFSVVLASLVFLFPMAVCFLLCCIFLLRICLFQFIVIVKQLGLCKKNLG